MAPGGPLANASIGRGPPIEYSSCFYPRTRSGPPRAVWISAKQEYRNADQVFWSGLPVGNAAMTSRFQTVDNPNAPGGQGNGTQLYAINNSGALAGDYSDNIGGYNFGFYGSAGSFTTLAGPVIAFGIDAAGDVVGYGRQNNQAYGFLYNGSFNTYTDPLGTTGTAIYGVSNNGQYLAGGYYGPGTADAFVYHAGTYTTVDPAGAFQSVVRGVNNSGQAT